MSKARFICRLIDSFSKNAESIAVIDQNGGRQTTYSKFYTTSLRVASYLQARKLPPRSFIPICLPTSMEYLASEVGIWLSGHAVVPMGNLFPQERIDYITTHCEAPIVINEALLEEIAGTTPAETPILPEEDDVCALFYTSGSTGTPKGVLHAFRAFGGEVPLDRMLEDMHLSVMGVTTPLYYIASRSVFCVLFRGGTLTIVPPSVSKDIRQLERFLALQQVQFTFLPPSLLAHFHSQSKALKLVMTGAERLSNIHPDSFTLINHFGQTETCGAGATFVVDRPYENTPIGKPAAHVQYCILDPNGKESDEGELCMKGNLTLGYYKDPERTAQLYKGGWLHTGDIVRKLPDGNLVYVNRKDWMVKINGQRVEPGEVEIVLQKMDGIEQCVVKGFTATSGLQYLCAYYISPSGLEVEAVRDYLTARLPHYMVPSYFVRLERFPLNINRKVDRKALASPATDTDFIVRQPYAAPQNDTERQLCEAFSQALGISHIGLDDDFFILGGNSISVMQLQTLCPALPLSAQMTYHHRTPRNIAKAISHLPSNGVGWGKPSCHQHQADYPLSQTQLGIFAACMSRQGQVAYNNGMLFRLDCSVDLSRLAKAFETVVDAHPYVKTRLFIDAKGNPRQKRNDDEPYRQEVETVTDAHFELLRAELMQPFHLLADRLFRIRIFNTPSAAWLFMDFHHIIFDGYSFQVLLSDLNTAYSRQDVKPEEWSVFDIAQEEAQLRKTEAWQAAADWNKTQFASLDIVSLPEGDLHGDKVSYAREEMLIDLPYQEIEEACHTFGVTPNVLTTTVFGYLLGAYTHSRESLFATVYNGRKDQKTAHTIGMLVKTLPVHVTWQHQPTIRELLQAVKLQLLGSMSNDLFSFSDLNALNSSVNSSVLFAWQDNLATARTIAGKPYQQFPIMDNATGETLVVQLFRQDNTLRLSTEYQDNVYTRQFIVRLMQCYRQLLHGFSAASITGKPLSALPLVNHFDQQSLLTLGTGEQLEFDTTQTFTSLFMRQASLTPHAIAVVDKNTSITYGELNRHADVLASVLVKAGVTTDTFVALMLPRRLSFMVALLAVFKAGGAYIPLDYEYPYARLKYMLDDSETEILLTTRNLMEKKSDEGGFGVKKLILLDDIDFTSQQPSIDRSKPTSLAYMIYTSGSTGQPKGVMAEHRGLLNFLQWLLRAEQLKAGHQCAVHTSFSFDGSLFDLFPPLMCGATLHIMPTSLRHDLKAIRNYLEEHKIEGMLLTTGVGVALQMQYQLPLRFLMLGGEKLTFFKPSPARLYNCYGPTEFTVCSSYYPIDQSRNYDNIPIGRPVPNTRSMVVDREGRLVPRGVAGELCLAGCQLTRGYWHRPQLTSSKFVTTQFMEGTPMYRTGDLVRWNEEGMLEYLRRIDSQAKLRGFRIELGEIENKILEFPNITNAAVVIHNNGKTQYLAGFYCADFAVAPEIMRERLQKELPDYMIPQLLIQLESLPMTANGKIDRKSLSTYQTYNTYQTYHTPRQQLLLSLAQDLLGTNSFGVTDDMTLFGMNSLTAMRLAAMASEKGEELKVNDVLRLKTIEKIAAHKAAIGSWVTPPSPHKPIVIVVQGLTSYSLLTPMISTLSLRHSVFVVEPLQEHIHKPFAAKGKTAIVNAYVDMLQQNIPEGTHIRAFIGHSYGGELSYRCAAKWQELTGQTPRVLLFDTYFDAAKAAKKMPHMQEYVKRAEDGTPTPTYSGKVDYFDAAGKASDTHNADKALPPHIIVHPVNTSHFRLLDQDNINHCLSLIQF